MLKEIIAIRHGEAQHNLGHFYSTDPTHPNYHESHLTALGRSQAEETAQRLINDQINDTDICAVFSSPLPRALETARIVMSHLPIPDHYLHVDQRLIETRLGEREGLCYKDFPDSDFWFPDNPRSFGGETSEELFQRMRCIYQDTVNRYQHDEGKVLMFSHGSPIFMLVETVLGRGRGVRLPTAGYIRLPVTAHK